MNIDNDITCSNDGCSKKNMILCRTNTKWWFHSLYYWGIWVFSSSFWFILGHLCTNHYYVPLTIFFSPLDVHFPLLAKCVHSLATCTSHSDFLTGYYTQLGFFIFSTHHNYCTFIISRFVANDCFLVLGFFCYCWSSFCSLGSYLHRVFFFLFFVDCLLLFFLWVVFTRAFICLVLLVDGVLFLIFYIQGFSLGGTLSPMFFSSIL
jgi:hypothetical protein